MILSELIEYEEYYSDELRNLENIDVTVQCVTYNHIKYIRKCLEGFVSQKFSGNMEVVIFDDASTDGTSDVVREFAEAFPNIIHAFILKTNTYNHPRRRELLCDFRRENHRGKYIAWCEGDDYWIYDYKIQKQFDYMQEHDNVTMCFHNAIRFNESSSELTTQIIDMDTGIISDAEVVLCVHGSPPSASYFCRKEYTDSYADEDFYYISPVGDQPLRLWCAANGDVYYIDKVWSVRNYLHDGSWNYRLRESNTFSVSLWKKYLLFLDCFKKRIGKRLDPEINQSIKIHLRMLLYCKDISSMCRSEAIEWLNECDRDTKYIFSKSIRCLFYYEWRACIDYKEVIYKIAKSNPKELYIYGAGVEAQKYAQELISRGLDFNSFIVTGLAGNEPILLGHKVKCINSINVDKDNDYFWLGMNNENRLEVIEYLVSQNIYNIL